MEDPVFTAVVVGINLIFLISISRLTPNYKVSDRLPEVKEEYNAEIIKISKRNFICFCAFNFLPMLLHSLLYAFHKSDVLTLFFFSNVLSGISFWFMMALIQIKQYSIDRFDYRIILSRDKDFLDFVLPFAYGVSSFLSISLATEGFFKEIGSTSRRIALIFLIAALMIYAYRWFRDKPRDCAEFLQ